MGALHSSKRRRNKRGDTSAAAGSSAGYCDNRVHSDSPTGGEPKKI